MAGLCYNLKNETESIPSASIFSGVDGKCHHFFLKHLMIEFTGKPSGFFLFFIEEIIYYLLPPLNLI